MPAPIYKHYDQGGLDAQYNLRVRHPDHDDFFAAYDRESERVRGTLECRLDVPYGDTALQTLDVFPAAQPGAPVHIFIHGGYWQFLDKRSFSFPAEMVHNAGAAFISINYDLAPAVSIDAIVEQSRRALAWCHANAASFNGDPQQIYVSGHSAGGHLAVMLCLTDWSALGLPGGLVKGACAISGVFDLEPIRLSYQNAVLKLDAESVHRNSPLYHIGREAPPIIAAVGHGESEEFRRQNGMLATAWRARGLECEELVLRDLHHFDIVLTLNDPESPLSRAMCAQMGL